MSNFSTLSLSTKHSEIVGECSVDVQGVAVEIVQVVVLDVKVMKPKSDPEETGLI